MNKKYFSTVKKAGVIGILGTFLIGGGSSLAATTHNGIRVDNHSFIESVPVDGEVHTVEGILPSFALTDLDGGPKEVTISYQSLSMKEGVKYFVDTSNTNIEVLDTNLNKLAIKGVAKKSPLLKWTQTPLYRIPGGYKLKYMTLEDKNQKIIAEVDTKVVDLDTPHTFKVDYSLNPIVSP